MKRLVVKVTKAFECPWHRAEPRGGKTERYCGHPNPAPACERGNDAPPFNCPLRAVPMVVEVNGS